jgi:hypothetical protein
LRAAEWDRLDLLDDHEEADRILRQYTAFLAFNDHAAPSRKSERHLFLRTATGGLNVLLLGIVAVPLIGAAVYLLGDFGDSAESQPATRQGSPAPPATPPTAPKPKRTAKRKAAAEPRIRLVVTAASGDSWVEARAGSATARVIFAGTIPTGRTLHFSGRRLWLRMGAASNLAFTINGRRADPGLFGTVEAVVTPQGLEPA